MFTTYTLCIVFYLCINQSIEHISCHSFPARECCKGGICGDGDGGGDSTGGSDGSSSSSNKGEWILNDVRVANAQNQKPFSKLWDFLIYILCKLFIGNACHWNIKTELPFKMPFSIIWIEIVNPNYSNKQTNKSIFRTSTNLLWPQSASAALRCWIW